MTEETFKTKALALWNKAVGLVVSYPKTATAVLVAVIVIFVVL